MNSDQPTDERLDGLQRQIAELQARVASTQMLVKGLTALVFLAVVGAVLVLVFPEWLPRKTLAPGSVNTPRDLNELKLEMRGVTKDLSDELLETKKELKQGIEEAKRQAVRDGLDIRKLLVELQESTKKDAILLKKSLDARK